MTYSIYLLRDKVALSFVRCFDAANDNAAVRYVVDVYGQQPHYTDLELWRYPYGYDIETGEATASEKAVVALPPAPERPPVDSQLNLSK